MKVTQTMVAEKAGVRRSTVSYVLSGRRKGGRISDAVAARVRRIAAELGYVPNHQARALATGRSRVMALLMNGLSGDGNWIWGAAIEGAEEALFERGYDVLLRRLPIGAPLVPEAERLVREGRADGVITLLWRPAKELAAGSKRIEFPLVTVNIGKRAGRDHISHDSAAGLREAVKHLNECRHRELLWISPRLSRDSHARDRLQCVRDEARQRGMRVRSLTLPVHQDEVWLTFSSSRSGILNALREYLPDPLNATALLCWNDFIAHAVCGVLKERGARIPEEVSVIGFDDMKPATNLTPLTTVSGAYREMGAAGARQALDIVERKSKTKRSAHTPRAAVPTYLIVRESTGPAPARNDISKKHTDRKRQHGDKISRSND